MYYYHAGYGTCSRDIYWSPNTHESREDAETEALDLASDAGPAARPVIEYWRREHGRYPGDCDAVIGCDWLDIAHGYTFAAWLEAAGRAHSASEYDLRAAWRAGEDPSEYA